MDKEFILKSMVFVAKTTEDWIRDYGKEKAQVMIRGPVGFSRPYVKALFATGWGE